MTHSPTIDTSPRTPDPRRVQSELVVARRYLSHGFIDAALRLFARRAAHVRREDWGALVERLLERGRVADAVAVCRMGDLPLPRERLLTAGDRQLRLKDVDGAAHYYELAHADAARWAALLDVLTRLPGRELNAMQVAQRHLIPAPTRVALRAAS
jgi:hypothetical protein